MPPRARVLPALLLVLLAACSSDPPPTDAGALVDGNGADAGSFTPAAHPAFPVLPMQGASQIASPRLVVIVAPGEPLASAIFDFADALLTSDWLPTTGADYGVTTPVTPAVHLTGAAMPATMGLSALRAYVASTIASHPEAATDGSTIYLVVYPSGTTFGNGCSFFAAHYVLDPSAPDATPTDGLAYVQRCALAPGLSEIDYLTSVASHEIIEALSDAKPSTGWVMPTALDGLDGTTPPWGISSWSFFQSGAVENADLCEGAFVREGGHLYQRVWSTTAARAGGDPCVPALTLPYFSASTASDWIVVPPGTTTMVPVTGWSTGARADWTVSVDRSHWVDPGFSATFAGGMRTASFQNGRVQMLAITAPRTPGEFAVFRLSSSDGGRVATPSGGTDYPVPASGDAYHDWVFGVHTGRASGAPSAGCGDGQCDGASDENCGSCPEDCGACGLACGPNNFGVACGTGFCPAHSQCVAGSCTCDTGFAASRCDGTACPTGGCSYPDFWCTPASCGAANFDAPCGSAFCPSAAECTPSERCLCPAGTQVSTCDGQECPSGGCSYPDYWCASCGEANFTVTCGGGRACPAFSTCNADGTCSCNAGYRSRACDGRFCSDVAGGCARPGWWCEAS